VAHTRSAHESPRVSSAFDVAIAAAPTWLVGGGGLAMEAAAMGLGWMAPRRVRPVVRPAVAGNQILPIAMPAVPSPHSFEAWSVPHEA
jgi:hypothetical protein